MHVLHELKDMLRKELDEIVRKGSISHSELECVDKAVDIIKDIETIAAMKGDDMLYDEYSGARRRDARGRYTSRDMHDMHSSYDHHEHDLRSKIQNMMRETHNDEERQKLQRILQEL